MLMRRSLAILWLALAGLLVSAAATAEVRIASWNIQNLGLGDKKNYQALGAIGSQFDFIAVQELRALEGLERFEMALEQASGEAWESMNSHALGPDSHQEHYAFVWRQSKIGYLNGEVVYIDDRDKFRREPYSARFEVLDNGPTFVAATVHVVYGKSVKDRTPEVTALRAYWDWLEKVYPEDADRRILLGDFNLVPEHPAWEPLRQVAKLLITDGATTLSSINGRYANLYDNILVSQQNALPISGAAILPFPELLNRSSREKWDHEKARRHVSDHAPVYVILE